MAPEGAVTQGRLLLINFIYISIKEYSILICINYVTILLFLAKNHIYFHYLWVHSLFKSNNYLINYIA